ncbi:hypothetical protein EZY14_019155 [Kordia sp. TARA_039_SRF]|nr:hypothetical protein EZY14_019155 [Kordia sp. TARA_039_SRF]
MKKIFLLVALAFSVMVSAQNELTEGKITSKQTMSTDNEQVQAQFEMMGKMETVTLFKGQNSRSELDNPMSGTVTTVINMDTKKMMMLMDNPAMGKLYNIEDISITEEDLKNIKVTKGSKTKTVLGYKCQQYITSVTKDGVTLDMDMYTTDAIKVPTQYTATMGDKVSGFPLYMEMKMNQMGIDMKITTEVTKIEKQSVSSEIFKTTPPEGYKNMKGM